MAATAIIYDNLTYHIFNTRTHILNVCTHICWHNTCAHIDLLHFTSAFQIIFHILDIYMIDIKKVCNSIFNILCVCVFAFVLFYQVCVACKRVLMWFCVFCLFACLLICFTILRTLHCNFVLTFMVRCCVCLFATIKCVYQKYLYDIWWARHLKMQLWPYMFQNHIRWFYDVCMFWHIDKCWYIVYVLLYCFVQAIVVSEPYLTRDDVRLLTNI